MKGRQKKTGKIYSKKTNRLNSMSQKKTNLGIIKKLPKPSTTHPPGTPIAPPPGFSVKHGPCASLGGS